MKRKIALLLVFCMLTTMLPAALADEIVQIEDGEAAVVELSDDAIEVVEDAPLDLDLELEDLELGQLDLEDLEQPSAEAEDVPGADAPEAASEDEETEEGNASTTGVPAKLTLGVKQTYTLDPSGIAKGKTVTYKSSKTSVATVSKKGVITAKKTGTAKITLTASKKTIATCTVTVVSAPKQMTLPADSIEITVKETYQIKPKLPSKTMASFTYTTKDKKIATVSKDGLVTGVKLGTTEITVKTHNKLTATLKVTVKATEPTAPGSVKLDVTKATLSAGDTLQLTATLPKNTASALTWTSDNASVATVNDYGLVTAVGSGTAKITVKTANNKKATCTVTVKKAPGKVTMKPTKVTLGKGESIQLTATLPKGTTSDLTWKSSKSSVAKVSETGLVTAVKVGTAKITVSTYNGKKATCTVTVKKSGSSDAKAPSKVSLDVSKATLSAGDTLQLTAKLPAGTVSSLSWSSSDTAVAKVKSTGLVTAVKAGTAKITVETANNKKATCTVTVKKAPESVTLNAHELIIGVDEIFQLRPTLTKGTTSELTWKSSKSSVATVNENGLITAKREGTAKITVETYNGKKDTCNVTVEKAALLRAYTDQDTFNIAPQATATLSVKVECRRDPELTYTWYQGDAAIADATGASYTVSPDKVGSYAYRCVVSDGSSAQEVGFTVNVGNTFSAKAESATAQTIYVGQTATLSVSATCAVGQPTYQWYKGDAAISGATGATYTTVALNASTAYKCVVADGFGSATVTLDFTVSVKERTLTSATAATASFNLKPGEKATLQVNTAGDGNPTLTYKWYQGSAEITGATGASYTVTAGNVGSYAYSCVVTDGSASKNSATVNFTVNVNNSLDVKAGSATTQTVFTGKAATLSVTASCATGDVAYQWYEGDAAISGATGASYSATKDTVGTYTYKCVVGDSYGSETATLNFTVTVKEPSLTGATAEAASVTVAPEKTATLKVNATCDGEPGLTYVWYAGDEEIAGATEASYTVTAGNVGSYAYSCVVTDDSASKNSATVSFTVNVNNSLDAKADSATEQTAFIGEAATLSVTASCATGDVAYQWYEGDEAISGATGASYSATKDAVGSYAYKCVVADSYGSETATLSFTVTVKAPSLTGATAEAASVTIAPTNTATLKVNVTCDGAPGLTYAWYAGDEEITGATEASYTVTAGNVGSYAYSCVVTDGTNTEEVTFEVNVDNDLEVVAVSETEQTVSIGHAATLDVEATCAEGAVTIRWFEGDEEIAGADGDSYSVTKDEAGTYAYRCVVEDAYGSESQAVGFTVTVVDAVSGIRINETNFPDPIFRSLVAERDDDGDGALSDDEISDINYLWYDEGELTSIQGVEYLTALEELNCSQNHGLTTVDLSANTQLSTLYINDCGLTELDLSHNANLETLYCQGNPLTELDITNCSSMLKRISWSSYSEEDGVLDFAGYLQVDSNVNLIGLPEPEKPDAEPLNLGQAATATIGEAGAIAYFSFTPEETGKYRFYSTGDDDTYGHLYNSDMREIASDDDSGDDANFRITETLEAGSEYILGARFLDEDATGSFEVYLVKVEVQVGDGIAIDETNFPDPVFRSLVEGRDDDGDGALSDDEISNITSLWYDEGELTSIQGVEYLTALEELNCSQNRGLTAVDLSANTQLSTLYINDCGLTELDLSNNANLETLYCQGNPLTELDLTNCGGLLERVSWDDCYDDEGFLSFGGTLKVDSNVTIIGLPEPEKPDAEPLTLGQPATATIGEAEEIAYFSFTPEETGAYEFYSTGEVDSMGRLYNSVMREIENDDGSNFRISAKLDAGKEYFLAAYFLGDSTGSITVCVERLVGLISASSEYEGNVAAGSEVTLRVVTETTDDEPLDYQWFRDDGDGAEQISGETASTYTLTATRNEQYKCEVRDAYGHVESVSFWITIENGLEANAVGENDVTANMGQPVTLAVTASCDEGEPSYQWYRSGESIDGENGAEYTGVAPAQYTEYYCRVSDDYGNSRDVCFYVTVEDWVDNELQVSAESEDITVTPGESAMLEAQATAADMSDMTCQWFYQSKSLSERGNWNEGDWIALGDPTAMTAEGDYASATCTLDADEVRTTRYRCEVTDKYGATASAEFNVQVERNLYADWDGENSVPTVPFGEPATLVFRMIDQENWETVTVEDLSYSWYKLNGDESERIDGQTGASYTIPSLTETSDYMCVAVDSYWNLFARQERVTVENHLTITIPKSEPSYVELWEGNVFVIVAPGMSATLMADASCDTDQMTFQWYENNGQGGIAGATGTSYTTPALYEDCEYSCEATDNYGTSKAVAFNVRVVDFDAAKTLEAGVLQSVTFDDYYTIQVYSFTPSTTGEYTFSSSDVPEADFSVGRLYDGNMNPIGTLEENPYNYFKIVATLTGGEQYYLVAIDPGYCASYNLTVE